MNTRMAMTKKDLQREIRGELPDLYDTTGEDDEEGPPAEVDFSRDPRPPLKNSDYFEPFVDSILRDRSAARSRMEALSHQRARRAASLPPGAERETRNVVGQNLRTMEKDGRGRLDPEAWTRWKSAFGFCCAYCGKKTLLEAIEHVVPLSRGGENTVYNVVPACAGCNMGKGTKEALGWLARTGRLAGFVERIGAALGRVEQKNPTA